MDRSDRPQKGLGSAIRHLRDQQEETQEALASKAEVTTGLIGLIERGEGNPTWSTVRQIADGLGVSIGELATLSEKFED
jgi:transcriptional regulator with XRE-family HTH domain